MAVRACYYIVDEDGTFYRLKKKTFYRIIEQKDDELHPEFAGRRIKYAEIFINYTGRRPIAVHHANFSYLPFDREGGFDSTETEEYTAALVRSWGAPGAGGPSRFREFDPETKARFEGMFKWEPTDDLREQIYAAALSNKLVGGNPQ